MREFVRDIHSIGRTTRHRLGSRCQYELPALRHTGASLLPLRVFECLHWTEPGVTRFLLMQINERLHWFMGNFAAYGLLDADRLVARALAGLGATSSASPRLTFDMGLEARRTGGGARRADDGVWNFTRANHSGWPALSGTA